MPVPRSLLLLPIMIVLGVFALQLFRLQIFKSQEYLALAEGNRLRVQYLFAPRGAVYDRTGENLVQNLPSFELVATPLDLPKEPELLEAVLDKLCAFFELEKNQVIAALDRADPNSFYPLTLDQSVEREKAVVFATQSENFPGFSILNSPVRDYLDGPIFAHVLGYTGKLQPGEYEKLADQGYLYNDIIGKEGLEAQYETYLRGLLGQRLVEVDASGSVRKTFQEKPSQPGSSLKLNLDLRLQKVLYESLSRQVKLHRATRAAAVALDPKTGGVLALVNLPGYDNNWFATGISAERYQKLVASPDQPLFNRAVSGVYPPGSTIKPIFAAGALAEGVITEKTLIFDGGQLIVPNTFNPALVKIFRGWNPKGLGNMNVYSAIAQSSDIFFYTLGGGQAALDMAGMGPDRLARYLSAFYFGRLTGIDLPGESSGLVPNPAWKAARYEGSTIDGNWYLGDTYNMSIGQGFNLATPLQLAVYTAALANGGKLYQPQLVRYIEDNSGEQVREFAPLLLSEIDIERKYLDIVKIGMRQAVTDGTARSLAGLPIAVAGKTGTSQFDSGDLKNTHAWFISFAPYEDPTIALSVLVESGGEGSGAAAATAADVYRWYAENRL